MIQDAEIKFETDYDWRRMIGIYDALIEKQRAGLFDATAYSTPHVPDLVAHDIGSYGMLFTSQQLTPNEIWYVWNGQLLETVFPWSAKLRQKFGSHGIDLVDFSLQHTFNAQMACTFIVHPKTQLGCWIAQFPIGLKMKGKELFFNCVFTARMIRFVNV